MKTITQDAYVAGVLEFYRWHDIIPGDPNEGQWDDAHYPAPRAIGDDTIPLLRDHRIVQGLLQSEEYQRCCFWAGDAKPWLEQNKAHPLHEYLSSLYTKWASAHKRGGTVCTDPLTGDLAPLTTLTMVRVPKYLHDAIMTDAKAAGVTYSEQVRVALFERYFPGN